MTFDEKSAKLNQSVNFKDTGNVIYELIGKSFIAASLAKTLKNGLCEFEFCRKDLYALSEVVEEKVCEIKDILNNIERNL